MFRVGQKVVCVKRGEWVGGNSGGEIFPSYGEIYTIRDIECEPNGLYLRFCEIRNARLKYKDGMKECYFVAICFRPVVSRKTDISIFTEMLVPSQITVDAMKIADHAREIAQ